MSLGYCTSMYLQSSWFIAPSVSEAFLWNNINSPMTIMLTNLEKTLKSKILTMNPRHRVLNVIHWTSAFRWSSSLDFDWDAYNYINIWLVALHILTRYLYWEYMELAKRNIVCYSCSVSLTPFHSIIAICQVCKTAFYRLLILLCSMLFLWLLKW